MILRLQPIQDTARDNPTKWFNSPVALYQGTLTEIEDCIPTFERHAFDLPTIPERLTRANGHLDTIVRLPFGDDDACIPIGVVSKNYELVQHTAVLRVATKALAAAQIAPTDVRADLALSEHGERMALSLFLPGRFTFDPGDGCPMALRLECFNSVDGSTGFRALMGWFRFVCSNGMIIGVTHADVRRRHLGDIQLENIQDVLTSGLAEAESEKTAFARWRSTPVTPDAIAAWADADLREVWGFKAAARAFHIAHSGRDAEVLGPYKGATPTSIAVRAADPVPGTPERCGNLFDLSQILAWLAQERRDIHEQLAWRAQIAGLMAPLTE